MRQSLVEAVRRNRKPLISTIPNTVQIFESFRKHKIKLSLSEQVGIAGVTRAERAARILTSDGGGLVVRIKVPVS